MLCYCLQPQSPLPFQQGTDAVDQVRSLPALIPTRGSITRTKIVVAVFSLVGIATGAWMYVVAGSLGTDIATTDCALGLAISDAIDSDSCHHFANKSLLWKGLKPVHDEGKKLLSLFDETMEQFEAYLQEYPTGLLTREVDLTDYIRKSIYESFVNRKARSPANGSELFAPIAIRNLPERSNEMATELNTFAGPALSGSNTTYEAAKFVTKYLNRGIFENALSEIKKQADSLTSTEKTYWSSKDVRQEIEDRVTTSIKGVGITAIILTGLSLFFLVAAILKPSSRLAVHFVYNIACLAIVLMLALLVAFLPMVVVLSDTCYAIKDAMTPEKLKDFGFNGDQTRLLEFCMFDSGNMAKYYKFEDQLEFAHTLTATHKNLEVEIKTVLPTASKLASEKMTEVTNLDANLHGESEYYPAVNKSVAGLNAMTNVHDPHCRFPHCKRLVDLWKLHPGKCDNVSYIINGDFGTPRYPPSSNAISCLKVEDWQSTVFSNRYTNASLNCTNATQNIATIKGQFTPIADFATDMHKIHSDLIMSISQYTLNATLRRSYKSSLDTTYTEELGVWESFNELMVGVEALLDLIGDSRSGFLAHVNCSIFAGISRVDYIKEAYQRVRGGTCIQFLDNAKLLVISIIMYVLTMLLAAIAGMILAHKTRPQICMEDYTPVK